MQHRLALEENYKPQHVFAWGNIKAVSESTRGKLTQIKASFRFVTPLVQCFELTIKARVSLAVKNELFQCDGCERNF